MGRERLIALLRRRRVLLVYSLTLVATVLILAGLYEGYERVTERKPLNVALIAKLSDLQDGSIVLFDVTEPWPQFETAGFFEDSNVIRLDSPDVYIFEPNDPAQLELSLPLVLDDPRISSIPQPELGANEESIFRLHSSDVLRLGFTPEKNLHVLMGFPSDFPRLLGHEGRLLTFNFRSLNDPPRYKARLDAKEGTPLTIERSRTDASVIGVLHDTFSLSGRLSPDTFGNKRLAMKLGVPAPEPGSGFVLAGDVTAAKTGVAILVPAENFFTQRVAASMVIGQERYKVELTDRLSVRNLQRGLVSARSDSDILEVRGSTNDVSLNGQPLVKREFERMSPAVQGALAGVVTTVMLGIGRLAAGAAATTVRDTRRTE